MIQKLFWLFFVAVISSGLALAVQCNDGLDNDGDGAIDFSPIGGGDLDCADITGDSEGCYDTDGGQDYLVVGMAKDGITTGIDDCPNADNVREYYCFGGSVANTLQSCDGLLGVGGYGARCSAAGFGPWPGGGICEEYCEETDGGLDYFTSGSATKGIISNVDACGDGIVAPLGFLKEQYCNAGVLDTDIHSCLPAGCAGGKCLTQCNDGIDNDADGCIDYDGGDLGCIDASDDDESGLGCSMCADGIDNDGDAGIDFQPIGGGDSDCLDFTGNSEGCFDTDGGLDYVVAGTAKDGVTTGIDDCPNADNVREYYCSGGNVANSLQSCDAELGVGGYGAQCSSGKCIEYCEETDGGLDYFTSGTATKGVVSNADACGDGFTAPVTELKEQYCNAGNLATDTHDCLPDDCVVDACVPAGVTQCSDSADNDADTHTDFPDDCGCSDANDDDESGCPVPLVGCDLEFVLWSDGYEETATGYKDVPIYMVLVSNTGGENCGDVSAYFTITNTGTMEEVTPAAGDDFSIDFEYDADSDRWHAVGWWSPKENANYMFNALLQRTVAGVEETITPNSPVANIMDCPLPAEQCTDIWWIDGGSADEDGVPDAFMACLETQDIEVDCPGITFGECQRNDLTGNYEQIRELKSCESSLPPCCTMTTTNPDCIDSPSFYGEAVQRKPCDYEEVEGFPMFDWVNVLVVCMMIITYYVIVRSNHTGKRRRKLK
ncbi:MAG: hypothetical protein ABIB71_07560 [Candidatus Woesearchaeota archaeon]